MEVTNEFRNLLNYLESDNYEFQLNNWVNRKKQLGFAKNEIYLQLLDLCKIIQSNKKFKNNELIYDNLCDFLDGFTNWAKKGRILPDEPDVDC